METAQRMCFFVYVCMRALVVFCFKLCVWIGDFVIDTTLTFATWARPHAQAALVLLRRVGCAWYRRSRAKWRRVWWAIRTDQLNGLGRVLVPLWYAFGQRRGVAFLLILSLVGTNLFWLVPSAEAATYTWVQTDWSGGEDGGTRPTHASNQTGWTEYETKDAAMLATTSLAIASTTGAATQTTDTDFNAGTLVEQDVAGQDPEGIGIAGPWGGGGLGHAVGLGVPQSIYHGRSALGFGSGGGGGSTQGGNGGAGRLGGGGGGAAGRGFGTTHTGGAGGQGVIVIQWSLPSPGAVALTSGTDWTVPAGVTSIKVWAVGAGGGGGGGSSSADDSSGGGGGAGGVAYKTYSVSPEEIATISIGASGAGGVGANAGSAGGTTTFTYDSVTITATGGEGGTYNSTTNAAGGTGSGGDGDMTGGFGDGRGTQVGTGLGGGGGGAIGQNAPAPASFSVGGDGGAGQDLSGLKTAVLFTETSAVQTEVTGSGDAASVQAIVSGDVESDTWETLASSLPTGLSGVGSADVFVVADNGFLYAHRGTATSSGQANNFFRYDIEANDWTAMASSPNAVSFARFAYLGGDYIYALINDVDSAFYRYSIAGNTWEALEPIPFAFGNGVTLEAADGYLYSTTGGTRFLRYASSTDEWESMTDITVSTITGSTVAYTGGDFLYFLNGQTSGESAFRRYSISGNSWSSLASLPRLVVTGSSFGWSPLTPDFLWMKLSGNNDTSFYRYRISTNEWDIMTSSAFAGTNQRNSLVYPGSGNYLYKLGTASLERYTLAGSVFSPPGEFQSSAIDLGQASVPLTFAFASTSPVGTSLQFQLRSADTSGALSGATWLGPTGAGDYYEVSTTTINSSHVSDRWFQYRTLFNSDDSTETPVLESATINYEYYPATTTATSSAFNAGDAANVVAAVSWQESLAAGTDVKFQIRTAPDSGGNPGTFTGWMGPDGTADSYFTDPEGEEDIPAALSDGVDDQWMQYRVFLTGDGTVGPYVHEVTMTYVVNAPPEFNADYPSVAAGGASASQASSGTVTINYSVRDPDTDTGSLTPGEVTPSFEYSLDNGGTWNAVTAGIASGGTSTKVVDDVDYTVHSAVWTPTVQFTGTYDTDAKIRVTVDDSEAANNTASSSTAAFTLDVKSPESASIVVDASQTPAQLTLTATDDTAIEMKIGTASDLAGSDWEAFDEDPTFDLDEGEIVYVQFRDAFGNTTAILSADPPDKPENLFYADISNPGGELYQEFVAWGVVSSPSGGFAQYNVHRSVNGGAFSVVATISDRLTNYYADFNLNPANTYAYKVSAESAGGNISFFSATTPADAPDGTGSSAISLPVISSVTSTNVTPTTATITWTTNELADSTVYYEATGSWPGSSSGDYAQSASVPSMVTSHSVTLSSLSPNTQYFFMVRSEDPLEQASSSASSLYTFTTALGVEISNVTVAQTFDTSAVITWNTSDAADATVTYDTDTDFSSPQTANDPAETTAHSVTLTGLTSGQTYYFYVSSEAGGNTTTDRNVVDGTAQYYSLNTSQDSTAPTISSVTAALVSDAGATITWSTNEPARSQVEWGTTSSLGTLTASTSVYSASHSVTITGLTAETDYFYRVISADHGGNTTSDDNSGSKYTFTTAAEPGETIVVSGGGGGGGSGRDSSPPIVTDVRVTAVSGSGAYIAFNTSEPASGIVNYSPDLSYGASAGDASTYRATHTVSLTGLKSETTYNFRVTAKDVAGNARDSENFTFTTLEAGESLQPTEEEEETPAQTSEARRASLFAILEDIIAAISATDIPEEALTASVGELLARAVDAPVVSGTDLSVDVTARTATIRWTTDKSANSLVSYASADEYKLGTEKPYAITAGDPEEKVLRHTVVLENLEPQTTYHFQVRSESAAGLAALSTDSTFTTLSLVPDITNARFESVNEDGAVVRWHTDLPTKTQLELTNTETGEVRRSEVDSFLVDHSFTLSGLDIATAYSLRLTAIDNEGNTSRPTTLPFSTVLSSGQPEISNVRISTSLVPGRIETAQTIISWKTDRPSTSAVVVADAGGREFRALGTPDTTFVREHVVISTTLKPGTVYKIKVQSGGSGGTMSESEPYTVLTAKPSASVVDLIFEGFGKTFGFLSR